MADVFDALGVRKSSTSAAEPPSRRIRGEAAEG
jgi:hypothetical protein